MRIGWDSIFFVQMVNSKVKRKGGEWMVVYSKLNGNLHLKERSTLTNTIYNWKFGIIFGHQKCGFFQPANRETLHTVSDNLIKTGIAYHIKSTTHGP